MSEIKIKPTLNHAVSLIPPDPSAAVGTPWIAQAGAVVDPSVSCPAGYTALSNGLFKNDVNFNFSHKYSVSISEPGTILLTGFAKEGYPELGCTASGGSGSEPDPDCNQTQTDESLSITFGPSGSPLALMGLHNDQQDPDRNNYWFPLGDFSQSVQSGSYMFEFKHQTGSYQSVGYKVQACFQANTEPLPPPSPEPDVSCPAGYEDMLGEINEFLFHGQNQVRNLDVNLPGPGKLLITGYAREGHPEMGCSPAGTHPNEPSNICSQFQTTESFDVLLAPNDGNFTKVGEYRDQRDPARENYWFAIDDIETTVDEGNHTVRFERMAGSYESVDYKVRVCHQMDNPVVPADPPQVSCPAGYNQVGSILAGEVHNDTTSYSLNLSSESSVLITGYAMEGHPDYGCSLSGQSGNEPHPHCSQTQGDENFDLFWFDGSSGVGTKVGEYRDQRNSDRQNDWFPINDVNLNVQAGTHRLELRDPSQYNSVGYELAVCEQPIPDVDPVPQPTAVCPAGYNQIAGPFTGDVGGSSVYRFPIPDTEGAGSLLIAGYAREGHPEMGCSPSGTAPSDGSICRQAQKEESMDLFLAYRDYNDTAKRGLLGTYFDQQDPARENFYFPVDLTPTTVSEDDSDFVLEIEHRNGNWNSVYHELVACFNGTTSVDYGDAPASYGTPSNDIVAGILLGSQMDAEPSPLTSSDAQGDDRDNIDDDDGITFSGGATGEPGDTVTINYSVLNQVHGDDFLRAWIDWDLNGQFDGDESIIPGNTIRFVQSSNNQTGSFSIMVPLDAACGQTFARFRLASDPAINPTEDHHAGETEDYLFTVDCGAVLPPPPSSDYDHGDAPSSYSDALHEPVGSSLVVKLGAQIDYEPDFTPNANATYDDNNGVNDDDGVSIESENGSRIVVYPGETYEIDISAVNQSGASATAKGWIDFNGNGSFDAVQEIVLFESGLPSGSATSTRTASFTVPTNAACGDTFARFRITSDSATLNPSGVSTDGEAEDYILEIDCRADLGLRFEADPDPTVQLSDFIEFEAYVRNYGPSPAGDMTLTFRYQNDLENINITSFSGWNCSINNGNGTCTKNGLENGLEDLVFRLRGRVAGTYDDDTVSVSGTISHTGNDPNPTNDNASKSVDVEKVWELRNTNPIIAQVFLHAQFDEASLELASGDGKADFATDKIVVNPIQVPLNTAIGLELGEYPVLTTEFCMDNPSATGCDQPTDFIVGSVLMNGYTLSGLHAQTENSGQFNNVGPSFLTSPISIEVGRLEGGARKGRFVDSDPASCQNWTSVFGGDCVTLYDTVKTFSNSTDRDQYNWSNGEYTQFIFQTAEGRSIVCASDVGACEIYTESQPDIYRLTGVTDSDIVFYDPVEQRIGSGLLRYENDLAFEFFMQIISPFIEREN